jgi:mannose/fructose-specific phosphotransferase system component IIA
VRRRRSTAWGGPTGALVLSDMMGGTPCNVCLRLARDPKLHFELVTGMNLPMLITALANRHYMPLAQLAQKLVDDAARSAQRPLQKLRDHLPPSLICPSSSRASMTV